MKLMPNVVHIYSKRRLLALFPKYQVGLELRGCVKVTKADVVWQLEVLGVSSNG